MTGDYFGRAGMPGIGGNIKAAITVGPPLPGDAERVAPIAATAPDPWSAESLEKAFADPHHRCFVARAAQAGAPKGAEAGQPVGFACFFFLGGSSGDGAGCNADLEQVAVLPAFRRQGVALALLHHGLAALAAQGAGRVLLEVRASNAGAIALYKGLGFKNLARRPGMYQNPTEDGFLMGRGVGQRETDN